ncbi:MAG: Alpha-2-macroglobulin domain protein [Candidatus Magasanikbacteria bacterium GW2011_GWC2_37_14]|uniref:Alpha-2-macroglobulin domain protein n=1 Tax=Candidatus Magasanikbacteria bacterium GW2011_GWC2_37_14 TaxID=1619046 RepID=A0A0G0JJ95_9BACT|nr:MAG: Alpha-2-macroglobulin domain protein [Candidatus Magasanikbacteria bacterium GW2011_GWC2_37_14]
MAKIVLAIREKFKMKYLGPAFIVAFIIIILVTISYIVPIFNRGNSNLFSGFSKLMISNANAQDNFSLEPGLSDSLGVEVNSDYILKSKEKVETSLIKNNLRLEPAVAYDLETISDQEWKVIPKEPLPANTLLKISLITSYLSTTGIQEERDYAWAYQVKDTFKVLNSLPRNAASAVPLNTGIEITFSHDNFTNFDKYFSLQPSVQGSFEKHGRTMVFVPKEKLLEKTIYTVTIKKGLPLENSAEVLAEDYSFAFESKNTKTSSKNEGQIFLSKRFYEVASQDKPIIQVSAYGSSISAVSAKVYRYAKADQFLQSLKDINKIPYWSSSREDYRVNTDEMSEFLSFPVEIKVENNIKYIEFPQNLEKGFYVVDLLQNNKIQQVYIQVSDLVAYVNITDTDTLVWVNDLSTGLPASGVNVLFVDRDKVYSTDEKGLVVIPTPDNFYSDVAGENRNKLSVYLQLSRGSEQIFLEARTLMNFSKTTKVGGDYWSYVYTDRPLYQPTDVIKYWGMLKERNGEKIKEKVSVTLYKEGYVDYYYQPVKIFYQEVELDDLGAFLGEIKLDNLRPDYYNLQIKIGDVFIANKYISVEKYTKPAYQLNLESDKNSVFAGEEISFKAKASFFEGTPVSNLALVVDTPVGINNQVTNQTGDLSFVYTEKDTNCKEDGGRCWPKYKSFSVKPKDSELAEINASKSVRVFGPDVYLTTKTTYPEIGKAKIDYQTKFIDLAAVESTDSRNNSWGKALAPNIQLQVQVTKITYKKIETGTVYDFVNKHSYKTYKYDREEKVVDNFSAQTDSQGNYSYERNVEPDTSYIVRLKFFGRNGLYDMNSSYLYYYNGTSYSYYNNNNYKYYHLQVGDNDSKKYLAGENVSVKFLENDDLLPGGENRFLYTQLQNGLQEYQVVNEPIYNFTFEKRDVPNINLSAVHFNGKSYDVIDSGYNSAVVWYDYSEKDLKIKLSTDKEKYKPGEEVKMTVSVTDKNDRPVEAEVNLNLVDEAFYAVQDEQVSPIESLYARVYSGSLLSLQTHNSIDQSYGGAEKGGCFLAGTMISMDNGSKKVIEEIAVGDKIKTFSNPVSQKPASGKVTEVFKHTVPFYLIINKYLKVTPQHLIFRQGSFVEAGKLKVGDYLTNEAGEEVRVETIEQVNQVVEVYNFRVDPEHTYFADGIYVHNEKGGGPREFFTDAALFVVVKTNGQGKAETTFTLPDNITSWRVTAQGINDDLYAGVNVIKIPVSLPVFAEVAIGQEYLLGDKPVAKVRAFGTVLTTNDQVKFGFSSGAFKASEQIAQAFAAVYFPLPELKLGLQEMIFSLQTAKGDDAVKLPLNVIKSRLQAKFATHEVLTSGTKLTLTGNDPVTIVLSDEGQNQLYYPLQKLSWNWSDRIDQQIAKSESRKLLKQYYNETVVDYTVPGVNYQLASGGIALLPYSSEELELSARIAQVGTAGFDEESLKQYLFSKLENKLSNHEEISLALYGLAELHEPVLTRLNVWLGARQDLTVKEKLYLAQALADLGNKEKARQMFVEILNQYGETKDKFIILKVSDKPDEVFQATALSAVLAATLNLPEQVGLWNYLENNQQLTGKEKNSDTLFNLEKINYIRQALPQLKPSPAEVTYTLFSNKQTINITGGSVHAFQIYPSQSKELNFNDVEGQVGVSVVSLQSLAETDIVRDNSVGIKRQYLVNGKPTTKFKEGDTVEVRLIVNFSKKVWDPTIDEFQITDVLPSGLILMTKLGNENYSAGGKGSCFLYPYQSNGQEVKFIIHRRWSNCSTELHYFARVKTIGEYIAEPTLVQAYLFPQVMNYSSSEIINISQ